ncbi:methyltransferase [Streptomyces sp. Ru71]|uniref:methyltransferase n=1 Tax=Streptomyces sp. Ru71 TaxID=2080746 RepID=UPI000CDCED51|nr:methyltransferase [Streptomyces sp. Ru71]POX53150.1 methyltransferase [Streptomyces sp. Ru71]
MPSNRSEPSAWQLLAPLMDLVTPMALRVAATLRLADLIADGAERVDELAKRSGTDADALGRLLRHLVCHGVFEQPSPGRFTLNDKAELLRSDHPGGMGKWLDLNGFGGRMDLVFTGLLHSVRTGGPAWEQVFGTPFWDHLAAEPALAASFDARMARSPRSAAASAYDWSGVRHVVDVGGGTGALLDEVLQDRPGLRGTLVDLPQTVARGRRFLAERGLDGRCAFAGQSFFDPLPTGGDVYVLSAVLHDWADEPATAILRRCAEAAGPAGRVLVVEYATSAGADPAMFAEMDLRMLVISGGRERTVEEYGTLAEAAGLAPAEVRTVSSGHALMEFRAA